VVSADTSTVLGGWDDKFVRISETGIGRLQMENCLPKKTLQVEITLGGGAVAPTAPPPRPHGSATACCIGGGSESAGLADVQSGVL